MNDRQSDLWPSDLAVKVLSPVAIFKQNASALGARTQGLLEAGVQSTLTQDGRVVHEFQITAQALDGYTYTLFTATHTKDFVYPVTIRFKQWMDEAQADYWKQRSTDLIVAMKSVEKPPTGDRSASDPDALQRLLADLLRSSQTRAVLMSLIARINDVAPAQAAGS